jgi:phage-related protein
VPSTPGALQCVFWPGTNEGPVCDFLRALPKDIRIKFGADIRFAQNNWPVGKPRVGPLDDGAFEVRTTCNKVEYRAAFVVQGNVMHVLHVFVKKTQKTAPADLRIIATRRKTLT